jgi:SAM-dependent methyltransferase
MHCLIRKLIVHLFVALSFIGTIKASTLQHEEGAREGRSYVQYGVFCNIDEKLLIQRCMPKLTPEQAKEATKIYVRLIEEGARPINEGHGNSVTNIGKILTEGGYSFPPIMQLQGPFLQYCGTGNFKRVLDIGPGHGPDTIPLLLTHNVQVIAVDIYEAQLEALTGNVRKHLASSFPALLPRFATLKRNFAYNEAEVPSKYLNAFEGVNLSRVLHFLNVEQTRTMVRNIASMMKEGGLLSITVSTVVAGSKEENWLNLQRSQGFDDPGLVYYETAKTIRKHPLFGLIDHAKPGEVKMVDRQTCKLPDPSHKAETMEETSSIGGIPAFIHSLIQGRYFHTLESLKPFLDSYFDIIDDIVYHYDAEDKFLGILAKRKQKL